MPLYLTGFVLLGASFQNHLNLVALIIGWGLAEIAIMMNTVAVCKILSIPSLLSEPNWPSRRVPQR